MPNHTKHTIIRFSAAELLGKFGAADASTAIQATIRFLEIEEGQRIEFVVTECLSPSLDPDFQWLEVEVCPPHNHTGE